MAQQRTGGARDLVITYIKGDGCFLKFWALPLTALDTVKNIESHLSKIKNDLEASCRFSSSERLPIGTKCVVNSKIRSMWCRARVLLHQAYTVLVQLLDYGDEESISIADVRSMDDQLQSIPSQAIECILADVIPAGSNEWSAEAIKFCEGHLLYNTLSCFVVSEYMKLPVVRVAKKGENEAFVQRLINSGLAHIKPEGVATPPPTLTYKMNNMDQNSTHLVRVSCIENAHKFYVQLSVAEMELKHLMDTINRIPRETFVPLKAAAVHMPCLAQLSSNPSYYRGLITYIQQTRCKVFFVDYGFTELKDVQELRVIHPTFLTLSAQAICCSLPREANIDPDEFKRLIGFEHVNLTVLNRTTEAYIVSLTYRGHDVLSSQIPQNYVQQKLQLKAKCEVIVSYVNSVTEFYCQLTQLKEQQNVISNVLNSGYNFIPISLNECTPGKPVCVKFPADDIWYRARIVKVNHETDIEVFFVDFGNYDNVNLSDVRKIGLDLLKFPIQAFKCYLSDVTLPSDSKTLDDAFDLLEELTLEKCLLAQINVFSGDSGYGITLYSKDSTMSINERLQNSFISLPTIPVNDIEDVYITSFDSSNSFFGQFEKLDSDKLSEMQEKINNLYSGSKNTSYVPKEDNLVCARFHEDEQYYRAKVEKVKDGSCEVYFIDYGNRESIPIEDIHIMDVSFTKYPQFGTECALENCSVQVPNDKLTALMLENSVQLKMNRKEKEKWFVSLVESFPGNVAILELIRQCDKMGPRSIRGTGLGGYQEKSSNNPQVSRSDFKFNDQNKNSHFNAKSDATIQSHDSDEYSKNESPNRSKHVKEFEEYFLISVPPNAFRNVYVSHVISPSEFYCQIEEDSIKLQSLMKAIEDTYTVGNDLNLSEFVIDAPCCAMYEDCAWYRGKIKKIDSQSCDVFFVDYGNTDAVSKSNIKMLKNDLFRWPAQALCCKSFNISPKGKDWNDDEINAFINMTLDKSFVAQFVECDNKNVYAVNLVSIGKLQEDVFNKEFVNMGFGRLQDVSKTLVLNSHAASTNLSFSSLDVEIGSCEAVEVTFGLNPGEIFCQLKSYAAEFKQMMTNLQNYYNKVAEAESLIDRPHQGMICAAQFFLDSAWYRAEIKKVEANKIIVFYVDYGNTETVDRKKVRCIIQEYTTLPMQAIKCKIRGIKPPGKSWTVNENLSKYFEGNAVCKFISKDNDYFLVDMTCNQKDVAQLLISDKLAVSDTPASLNKVESPKKTILGSSQASEERSKITKSPENVMPAAQNAFVPGQLISVTVSFIENPSKFWCQLLDECDILNQLMADIESQVSELSPVNEASLNIGSYCIAQYFEDEAWYRAQIINCESGNTYKVFFIDYGNTEAVTISQMKMMPLEFMEHPPQCFECCLLNTPTKLLPEMTTLFRNTVEEVEEITAKIEKVQSSVCTVTLLFDKDDQEINVSELLFGVKEPSDESGIPKEPPRYLPPDVPLGLQDGYVSIVNSPQDFYIQLANTEDLLADLSEELADISESAPSIDASEICVGYACSSKFSEDNNWYRAEIIAIKDSTVDVLFVDYGNVDTVEKDVLKNLNEKHLKMPPLAMKCKLNGIVPVADEWSSEAINTFQDMVLESCLGITFISKDIPATVNITKDDKEISQCLVDMELANVESSTETDEAYAEDHLAPPPAEDPLSSLPNDQSYPKRKLHSLKHAVKICYVDSYDKFYVMPLDLGTDLETVMNTLNILYGSDSTESKDSNSNVPESLEDPKVPMPCVAKYSEDEAWYRALITEIDGENIYVTFIDYGNSEITTLKNLRPLTPELVKIPPIALECSLFGIEAIPGQEQGITVKLEEYFVEEVEFEMEICESSPYKIKLFNDGDIGAMLVKEGLAKEQQSVLPIENEAFVDNSKIAFVDESLEYRIQISKRFFSGVKKIVGNVKFCEIENDLVVFHVVSSDLEDDLQNLQEKLQDAYLEPPQNLPNVACMDFCAAKYMEDRNWYRAQVLSFDKDKVKVRFIDYGNCETVDKSDIYELLSDFTVEPQFSVKCILFGLKVNKSKELELEGRLDELVYHDAIELNLCKNSHALYDLCITSLFCGDTDISDVITNELLVSQQYIISCQLDGKFKATIQKVEDDIIFLLPSNVIDERESFQSKLQEICSSLEISSEIQTHYLYAAKIDNNWYRVSVTNISGSEVTVDLVDFGPSKVVDNAEFVLLPLDVSHQPVFLQPCIIKSLQDLAGNVKIDIQHLSIGKEISGEIQKSYPIIHPFTIRILEADSNSVDNVIESQENAVIDNCFNNKDIEEKESCMGETITDFEGQIIKSEGNGIEEKLEGKNIEDKENFVQEANSIFEETVVKYDEITISSEEKIRETIVQEISEKSQVKSGESAITIEEDYIKETVEENIVEEGGENAESEGNVIDEGEFKDIEEGKFEDTEEKYVESEGNAINDGEEFKNIEIEKSTESEENAITDGKFKAIEEEEKNTESVRNDVLDGEEFKDIEEEEKNTESVRNDVLDGEEFKDIEEEKNAESEENAIIDGKFKAIEEEEKNTESVGNDVLDGEEFKDIEEEKHAESEENAIIDGGEFKAIEEEKNTESVGNDVLDGEEFKDTEEEKNAIIDGGKFKDIEEEKNSESVGNDILDGEEFKDIEEEKNAESEGNAIIDDEEFKDIKEEEKAESEGDAVIDERKFKDGENNVEIAVVDAQNKDYSSLDNVECKPIADVFEDEEIETMLKSEGDKTEFKNMESNESMDGNCEISRSTEKSEEKDGSSQESSIHMMDALNEQMLEANTFDAVENVNVQVTCNTEVYSPENESIENSNEIYSEKPDKETNENQENIDTVMHKAEKDFDKLPSELNSSKNLEEILGNEVQSEFEAHEQKCDPSTDVGKTYEDINSSEDKENSRGIEDSYQLSGSVQVKVSDIAISNGSVIFAVQPLYLQEEFLLLKQSMQDYYSSKTVPYNVNSETNFCVVLYENEWCRGKILQSNEDDYTIMLIDYGKCVSNIKCADIKNLDGEHSTMSPFAVWCTLSSVICPTEKSETATKFLSDKLKNSDATVKILEGDEPYKINIFIDGSSILNEMLKNGLVTQKLPNMYLEPGSFKAKLSSLNINSETVQIFVNISSFLDDYTSLFEIMQSTYKVEDFITNVVDSSNYAVFYNGSWYRGLVVSRGNEVQVYLVDTGETITDCKSLCFLLPEHCFQPAFAIPCHIPFSDIKATNEISEFVNNVLKSSEFLVNIDVSPDLNSISATLIDEQIINEVKNMQLSNVSDSEADKNKEMSILSDIKPSPVESDPSTGKDEQQETSEHLVGYLEETFTTQS